jgi:hypothetical protein
VNILAFSGVRKGDVPGQQFKDAKTRKDDELAET